MPPLQTPLCNSLDNLMAKSVHLDWNFPDDKILDHRNTLHMSPVNWCRIIRQSNGNDAALDELRRLIHLRIDQRFNAYRNKIK